MAAINCTWNGETGKVRFTPEYQALPAVTRSDFLKDIIYDLKKEYKKTLKDWQPETPKDAPEYRN